MATIEAAAPVVPPANIPRSPRSRNRNLPMSYSQHPIKLQADFHTGGSIMNKINAIRSLAVLSFLVLLQGCGKEAAPPAASAVTPPPAAAGSAGAEASGEDVYKKTCAACHAQGIAGRQSSTTKLRGSHASSRAWIRSTRLASRASRHRNGRQGRQFKPVRCRRQGCSRLHGVEGPITNERSGKELEMEADELTEPQRDQPQYDDDGPAGGPGRVGQPVCSAAQTLPVPQRRFVSSLIDPGEPMKSFLATAVATATCWLLCRLRCERTHSE